MKLIFRSPRLASSPRAAAFTLIELLTVMAIILVLAGLILNIAGSANFNAAKSRARSEIKAMETAVESYKVDNGIYPENSDTDKLDPRSMYEPTAYNAASNYLYQELTGNRPNSTTAGKGYIFPKTSQLAAMTSGDAVTTTSPNMYFVDPFGFSYGYSTAYLNAVSTAAATAQPGATPPTVGYNPTFDLWSTSGYARAGKGTPRNFVSSAAAYSALWINNW